MSRPPRISLSKPRRPVARTRKVVSFALVVIDHDRLQSAAWSEFHTVRKRLDKVTRELHRHEEIDVPAYDAWLHRTFPLEVTAMRELTEEVAAKAREVRTVQATAARSGRSLKRLWQEQKEWKADPEAFREKQRVGRDPEFGEEEDEKRRQEARPEDFERLPPPPRTAEARDIYRRLVQRLHPDRGGMWTPARQQLWHEVQKAWGAGDGDWLARLEIEWETAHEVIGPHSSISRLRAAVEELHAARRDIEHKLREYRISFPWRFTRTVATREKLQRRVEAEFVRERAVLLRQLGFLNRTIAAWEDDWTRPGNRSRPKRREFGFRRAASFRRNG